MKKLEKYLENTGIEFTQNALGNIHIENSGEIITISYHGVDGYKIKLDNEFGEIDYNSNLKDVKEVARNLLNLFR